MDKKPGTPSDTPKNKEIESTSVSIDERPNTTQRTTVQIANRPNMVPVMGVNALLHSWKIKQRGNERK